MPVRNPATAGIVWTHFDGDAVTRKDADVKLPHPSADRREDDQPVVAFDAEHRVRQRLLDNAIELELVALRLFPLTTFAHSPSLLPSFPSLYFFVATSIAETTRRVMSSTLPTPSIRWR